jgi:L-rhamnose isomerase
MAPRARFLKSLDEILSIPYDKSKVFVALESKVFGIGLESTTVGSSEFCMGYTLSRGIVPLMDNGHYHPTEVVSDKISSILLFSEKLALHVTRPVRWDSDHVVRLDDETKEIAKEIVCSDRIDDIFIALDYFDASINRIAAWTIGLRNFRKAMLLALLTPNAKLKDLQNSGNFTELFMLQEELKSYPWGAVWDEFCRVCGVAIGEDWFANVKEYEPKAVISVVYVAPSIATSTPLLSGRTTHLPYSLSILSSTSKRILRTLEVISTQANECGPCVVRAVYTGTSTPLIVSVWKGL